MHIFPGNFAKCFHIKSALFIMRSQIDTGEAKAVSFSFHNMFFFCVTF